MRFRNFAYYLSKIESTSLRLEITDLLAELYKKLQPEEGKKATYLLMGRLAPNYKGIELNLAVKLMIRVLAGVFNEPVDAIAALYERKGDLGDVAYDLADERGLKEGGLTIDEVYEKLMEVAKQEGPGSVERKLKLMEDLLKNAGAFEMKYLVRVPVGALRLGFSEITILDALSWMLAGNKSLRADIEKAFNVRSDIGLIVKMVLTARDQKLAIDAIKKKLSQVQAKPGVPIRPALAARLGSFKEIVEKLGEHGLEPKYDGLRTQIHAWREAGNGTALLPEANIKVKIYSRNLEDITAMFPEISRSVVELLEKFRLEAIILDGESIAYDPKTGRFYSFGDTIKRKRKYGIDRAQKDLPVRTFVFDVLYFDDKDVMGRKLIDRRRMLGRILKLDVGCLRLTPQHKVKSVGQIKKWFTEYIDENLEGIMCKKLDSVYQAGSRNFNWVKFKSALDSVDLVVLGCYMGKGKRSQFGIGAFLAGVYDDKNDKFLTVSKIGSGLTDEQWQELYKRCQKIKVNSKPVVYQVPKGLECVFWVSPSLVVEIKANEITKSPLHTSGYALRFPRLVRFRDDKRPTQATTVEELKQMAGMGK
ncbi:MAG: ATP-dependent DNA ligase [bacterium]|nr:ATP-dependent DNA ligase [bacterium]